MNKDISVVGRQKFDSLSNLFSKSKRGKFLKSKHKYYFEVEFPVTGGHIYLGVFYLKTTDITHSTLAFYDLFFQYRKELSLDMAIDLLDKETQELILFNMELFR